MLRKFHANKVPTKSANHEVQLPTINGVAKSVDTLIRATNMFCTQVAESMNGQISALLSQSISDAAQVAGNTARLVDADTDKKKAFSTAVIMNRRMEGQDYTTLEDEIAKLDGALMSVQTMLMEVPDSAKGEVFQEAKVLIESMDAIRTQLERIKKGASALDPLAS